MARIEAEVGKPQGVRIQELQLVVHIRCIGDGGAGNPARHRRISDDELQTRRCRGFRLR